MANQPAIYPVAALENFATSKPWRGTIDERMAKYRTFHAALLEAYNVTDEHAIALAFEEISDDADATSTRSTVVRFTDGSWRIILVGKLSVVTYLMLLAAIVNPMGTEAINERQAAALNWARETFARFFPRSARRIVIDEAGVSRSTPRQD